MVVMEPKNVTKDAGYVVYKDLKIVVFYSNDLANMPPEWYTLGNGNEDTIHCIHGVAPLHRWTGETILHCQIFQAPAVVIAYNYFMNAVNCMDQQLTSNPCQCCEK